MSYNPTFKVFYVKGAENKSENNRLVPAPKITVTPEYYYANNIAIGYTYNISLNGFSTSIDKRTHDGSYVPGFSDVIASIQNVKNIFNNNGGTLLVTNDNDYSVLEASGITVRSLSFDQSNNNWNNYAPYSIELEANEIKTTSCNNQTNSISCDSIPSGISISPDFIDIKKYRIKSFDDNWTFDLNDTIYNSYNFDNNDGKFNNEHFNIAYTINAVGKHYFVNDKLLPAWEQAKNYCQYRLYSQVRKLIDKVLPVGSTDDGCSSIFSLSNIFSNGNSYLLEDLSNSDYKIFNEKINCEASEAAGSFSLTYNAILKRYNSQNSSFVNPNTIHTFNLSKTISDDATTKNVVVTVDGNIQGLVEGGLILTSGIFNLPSNGQILLSRTPSITRYDNALLTYNSITANNRLKESFAEMLGISYNLLEANENCKDPSGVPKNSSHSSSHNYNEGIITYNSTYDTSRAMADGKNYSSVAIKFTDSTPTIAEFIIPGRSSGPIIQNVDCDTPKKISITIDGVLPPGSLTTCCPTFESLLEGGCEGVSIPNIPSVIIANTVLTENTQNYSTDGSFSISRSYIYYD